MRLPTFAPVPRYSVIGQYVLLITEAFNDIIPYRKFDTFRDWIIRSETLTYLFLLYLFIGIAVCKCLYGCTNKRAWG